jgi:hypothetical protein
MAMSTSRKCRWMLFCVLGVAFGAVVGCGRSDTVSLAGNVSLDGRALPTGTIELIPMDRQSGPAVGGELSEGRYQIPADHGPRRGVKYRVEIRSIDPASASTTHPLSRGRPVCLDRVPPAYNSESQLTLSVPIDAGNLQQDFELQSKAKQ